VHYVGRVGLDAIRAQIVENPQRRRELYERLLFALDGAADPWLEPQRAGVDLRQFHPLPTPLQGAQA
jgi:nitrite reductase (NADH) large subunit